MTDYQKLTENELKAVIDAAEKALKIYRLINVKKLLQK